LGAHGIRGEVRVRYFGDCPDNLLRASEIWLAEREGDPAPQRYQVERAGSGRSREVRLALQGIGDRDAAGELRGRLVMGDAASLEALPEGEYYWYQLIGCRVEEKDGSPIGEVREILETGAHDVLVVEGDGGRRHLIPAAEQMVKEIDIEAGRIVVELPPGLLEGSPEGLPDAPTDE
jgi:16S rRNA processing protein RimM